MKLVIKHGSRVGVPFNSLVIMPADHEKQSFAGGQQGKTIVFGANIRTAMGSIKNLQWVILHEAAHIAHDDAPLKSNLEWIAGINKRLFRFKELILKEKIDIPLKYTEKFIKIMSAYDAHVAPIVRTLKKTGLMNESSPEHMALLLESDDASIQWLKQTMHDLYPALSSIIKDFNSTLQEVREYEAQIKSDEPQKYLSEDVPMQLDRHSFRILSGLFSEFNAEQEAKIDKFLITLSKAQEYACDSFAQEHSTNPDSGTKWLMWYARHKAKVQNRSFEEVFLEDYTHPSLAKRVLRLEFSKEHSRQPEEKELMDLLESKKASGWPKKRQSRARTSSAESCQSR
jgi:hypothetical protein